MKQKKIWTRKGMKLKASMTVSSAYEKQGKSNEKREKKVKDSIATSMWMCIGILSSNPSNSTLNVYYLLIIIRDTFLSGNRVPMRIINGDKRKFIV